MKNSMQFRSRKNRVNISRVRSQIRETIHAATKSRVIDTTIEQIDTEQGWIDVELKKLRQHQIDLTDHPGNDPGADIESRGNRALATTFGVAAMATQVVVNRSALPHSSLSIVILASVGAELFFYSVGYATLKSINNRVRPEATIRIGKKLSLVLTGTVLVAGATAAYVRFATANTSATFFDVAVGCMWWVAEVASMTAGLWMAVARLRDYPRVVADSVRELDERTVELKKFRDWLVAQRDELAAAAARLARTKSPDAVEKSDERGAAGAAVKLAGIALAFSLLAGSASAQVCGLASERSMLGNPAARQQAVAAVVGHLDDYTTRFSCRTIIASSYTDAGAFSTRVALVVPRRAPRRDCATAEAAAPDRVHAMLGGFGGYDDYRRKQARDECTIDEVRRDTVFTQAWSRFVNEVRSVLAEEPVSTPTRVDIAGVLQGFIDAGVSATLVISPGLDTFGGIPEHLRGSRAVLIITFMLADGFGGRPVTEAAAERWRRAGAVVLPFTALVTPGIFGRMVFPPSGG